MHHIVHGKLVGLACKYKLGKHRLMQLALGRIDRIANKTLKVVLQLGRRAHKAFGGSITIVYLYAALLEQLANIALA